MAVVPHTSFRLYNDVDLDTLNKQNLSGSYDYPINPTAPIIVAGPTLITPAQIGGGMIITDSTTVPLAIQMPTAASLVEAFPNVPPGYAIKFYVYNIGAAGVTNAVTLTSNTGTTIGVPTATSVGLVGNTKVQFYAYFNVTSPGSQAVIIY